MRWDVGFRASWHIEKRNRRVDKILLSREVHGVLVQLDLA